MSIRARHLAGWNWELEARAHKLLADQSVASGGEDRGPMPSDLLLWSVASCFGMSVSFVAERMHRPLAGLELEVSGTKDPNSIRFGKLHIAVMARCPEEKLRSIVQLARKYCYITNSLSPEVTMEFEVRELGE